jgi:hypothetical protein
MAVRTSTVVQTGVESKLGWRTDAEDPVSKKKKKSILKKLHTKE